MWIDRLKNTVTYVMFDGHSKPRLMLDHSLVYQGMTVGVCTLSSSPITAPFPTPYPFEQEGE